MDASIMNKKNLTREESLEFVYILLIPFPSRKSLTKVIWETVSAINHYNLHPCHHTEQTASNVSSHSTIVFPIRAKI